MRNVLFILFFFALVNGHAQQVDGQRLAKAAVDLTKDKVVYDPSYFSIDYPNGDVPSDRGVCTDVVIRTYRKVGVDLQQKVHEDMGKDFSIYPNNWGLSRPDPNIDHRRVPNLMTFFSRHGNSLGTTKDPTIYAPGDIVCWDLGSGILHIGMVGNIRAPGTERYLIIHNIGAGQVLQDMIFDYSIIGHYRYFGQ